MMEELLKKITDANLDKESTQQNKFINFEIEQQPYYLIISSNEYGELEVGEVCHDDRKRSSTGCFLCDEFFNNDHSICLWFDHKNAKELYNHLISLPSIRVKAVFGL